MRLSVRTPNRTQDSTNDSIEISLKGKWVRVPALEANGRAIIVMGRWIKMAVVHDEEWLETEFEAPELCVKMLKEQRSPNLRADIFTFRQKIPGSLPHYNYPLEWESVAATRTANFKEWWESLPQESRKNVRRSQKRGVVVTVKEFDEGLIDGIIGVNNDSQMRQGRLNAHYGKSFDDVRKDHSSFLDRSNFICAHLGDELIGFLKVVYRGEVASILNLAVKATHNDKRPANALIAKAVELCETREVRFLTYGLFNYGNKRESPLREFKSRNGFQEVLTPRFYVPISRWGVLCMKAKLHRGLLAILPHSIITIGVNARAKWYNFKQSMSRCSSMAEQPKSIRQTGRSNPPAGSNV